MSWTGGLVLRSSISVEGDGLEPPGSGTPRSPRDRGTCAADISVTVASARYVLLPLAQSLTGYSVKAMQRKIERGDWPEHKVWRHAPDGHVLIDLVGYERWVENR